MGDTLDAMTEAEIDAIRTAFLAASAEEKLFTNGAAAVIGVGASTLAAWKIGKYPGNNSSVARDVQRWLDGRGAKTRLQAIVPALGFVPTPTSLTFIDCLKQAQYIADMVVIACAAGVGKTTSCRHYQDTHPQVWMMTADPSTTSALRVMARLCDTLGVRELSAAARPQRAIGKMAGSGGLLIVDEAQHLSIQALEQLRFVYDQAGVGLALVGNQDVWSGVDGGGRKSHMAQLFSRVGMRVVETRAKRRDADALLDAMGVDDEAVRKLLRVIARKPGALRGMVKVLRVARMRASQSEDGRLTAGDVNAAWARLSSDNVIEVAA